MPPAVPNWRPDIYLSSPFDVFKPIAEFWQVVFVNNLSAVLIFVYHQFQAVPALTTIGAFGLAVVVFTIGIRLVLAPLTLFQLKTQRKTMLEQRKLAPEVAELRKKFKKDGVRLNSEMQKLYQEHGINPLGQLVGCLPLIVQIPILTALFYVFKGFANSQTVPAHFLFVPNLNDNPNHHPLLSLFGFAIPAIVYLIFPLLAGVTTYVQTKMLQMPPPPNPTEQELQAQQMQKMMVWMSPLMIAWFALNVPAGLGLYYFVSNCVGIIQQYFVVGWGNLLPGRADPGSAAAVGLRGGVGPRAGPDIGPKGLPGDGSKNGRGNAVRNAPQTGRNRGKRKR